ncbi:S9 family peptidase [Adhaeribacter aquaticus]|uniref:S9 family peptidase n=1 Tax=Adhaeribacter aquaticus TaxID=299567 RepID=UPI000409E431|nr:S9 family peptidase [Adhaeribacter aquaticus]
MLFTSRNWLAILLFLIFLGAQAQQRKQITLEDIYRNGTFTPKTVRGVNWMKNGQFYTSEVADEKNKVVDVVRFDVTTGKAVNTIIEGEDLKPAGSNVPIKFNSYSFNADEQKVLFAVGTEPIYRHSARAEYYVYDVKSKNLTKLSNGGKQMCATFSPDAKRVAFARENNMFFVDLATMQETQITTNGKFNQIINGYADWVYEEEFSFAQGFAWSPDGSKIAFYTFDENRVPEYNMQVWGKLYPQDYRFKYPKAGEANSVVTVSVYHLGSGKTVLLDTGKEADIYLPRMQWTKNANLVSIQRMNRLQNNLEILHADATTGKASVILKETNPAYIEITDDLTYLENGKQFIFTSEKDGYNHLYLYNMAGKLDRQITKGNWEVSRFLGYDEKNSTFYYESTEAALLDKHLYRISNTGQNKKQLTAGAGTHTINMSLDFKYYLDYVSTANTPMVVSLHTAKDGKLIKVLEDNKVLQNTLANYQISKQEFFSLKTSDGAKLDGYTIKPLNFDATKKYPVLMFVYGGPGKQEVLNKWGNSTFLWYQYLANTKDIIIVCVDNRGTPGKGAAFKRATYANLGKYEIQDQIEVAKYLGNQPYVDKGRIGIWGHSFGGYMTLLALTKGNGLFRAGISVAPVTNWRYYDSIYTERYLKTPQENAAGYDQNSPLFFANNLQGKLLLIHGTGDDNVHFQNAVAMQDALISANKQFDSFYYPNRNHGVAGGPTLLHRFTMMTNFLEKNLINPVVGSDQE